MSDDRIPEILQRIYALEGRVAVLEGRPQPIKQPAYIPPPMAFPKEEIAAPPVQAKALWDIQAGQPPAMPSQPAPAQSTVPSTVHKATAEETEQALGGKILPWTGAGLVLLGITYLTALAIQRHLITPGMQFGGAVLLCLAFLAVGIWKDRQNESIGQLLIGLGSAGLYLTFAGGNLTFDLYSGTTMVGLFVLHSAANLAFGSHRGSKPFVVLGMLGGLMASVMPLMNSGPRTHENWQLSLVLHACVTAATMGICIKKQWDDVLARYLLLAFFLLFPIAMKLPGAESVRGFVFLAYGVAAAAAGVYQLSKSVATVGFLMLAVATALSSNFYEHVQETFATGIFLHVTATAAVVYACVKREWEDVLGGIGCVLLMTLLPLVGNLHVEPIVGALTVMGYGIALGAYGFMSERKLFTVTGLSLMTLSCALYVGRTELEQLSLFAEKHFLPSLAIHAVTTVAVIWTCVKRDWREVMVTLGGVLGLILLAIVWNSRVDPLTGCLVLTGYGIALTALGLYEDDKLITVAGLTVFSVSSVVHYTYDQPLPHEWKLILLFNAVSMLLSTSIAGWKKWTDVTAVFGFVLTVGLMPIISESDILPGLKAVVLYSYSLWLSLTTMARYARPIDDGLSMLSTLAALGLALLGFAVSVRTWTHTVILGEAATLQPAAGYGLWAFVAVLIAGTAFLVPKGCRAALYAVAAFLGLAVAPLAWANTHVLAIYTGLGFAMCAVALITRSKVFAGIAWGQYGIALSAYVVIRLRMIDEPGFIAPLSFIETWHLASLILLTMAAGLTASLLDKKLPDGSLNRTNSDVLAIGASCIAWFLAGNFSLLALKSLPENARLTVAWATVGLALLPIGFFSSRRSVRFASFSLLGMTLGKIVLIDLSQVDLPIRIAVLISLGVAILGLSYWFYLKPKGRQQA